MSAAPVAWFVLPFVLLTASAPGGSGARAAQAGADDGEGLAVYLITFGPGPRIWERFGHNAIWIRDTVTGSGRAYDYGRFQFGPGFFLRFARGRMEYGMGVEDGAALIHAYVQRERSVWVQQLTIAPAARVRLRDALEADWARDHGRYRYDYYRDNCSTRIRDAIDAAAGGAIRSALDTLRSGTSYRWHTRRSLESNPFNAFGVDASLGPAVDREISRYEETFLPVKLMEYVRGVTVPGDDGRPVPLVRQELAVAETDRYPVPERPSNRTGAHLLAGLGLGTLLAGLGRRGAASPRVRRGFVAAAALWALLAGLGGGVLAFFWALSEHTAAYRNENLFQLNLFALVLFALLAAAARGEVRRIGQARRAGLVVVGLALLGLALKALPGFGQANLTVIAFVLPVHLGVAAGLTFLDAAPGPSATPPAPR